jgi:glutamate mutase epsilon subunit
MKPVFERRIFWDVDFDKLDIDEKANFVISRIFERGDIEDIRQCRRYYGDEKIEKVILNVPFLPEHRMNLAAVIINRDISELKCYTLRQSNPELYPY